MSDQQTGTHRGAGSVRTNRSRLDLDGWPKWIQAHLTKTDLVVVEATTNAWDFYNVTSPYVQRVVVANAATIALIAKTFVRSDQKDVMVLARMAAAGLIPEVWVPPMEVRELRSLLTHRRRVIDTRTSLKNRLQSVLQLRSTTAKRTTPGTLPNKAAKNCVQS